MGNYCFTSGQDAKALLYDHSSTAKSRRENAVCQKVAQRTGAMNMYNSPGGLQTYLQPHHLYWIPTLVGSAVEEKGRENNMRSETYPNWSSSAE